MASKLSVPGLKWIVGLTGGIGSGKSAARKYLGSLGAVTIDADLVAHQVYARGSETFKQVVKAFGDDVVGSDGSINRKVLGSKVFSSASEMEKLNSIVWPAIPPLLEKQLRDAVAESAAAAGESKDGGDDGEPQIGVVEAAVMVEAGWTTAVDEVWVTQVPRSVAVERVMERNGLSGWWFTEDDATSRVKAQLSNEERSKVAAVVVMTDQPIEDTRRELRKHWSELVARVSKL